MKIQMILLVLTIGATLVAESLVEVELTDGKETVVFEAPVVDGLLNIKKPPMYRFVDLRINKQIPEIHTLAIGFVDLRQLSQSFLTQYPFIKNLRFIFTRLVDFHFINELPFLEVLTMRISIELDDTSFDIGGARSLEYIALSGNNWQDLPPLVSLPEGLKYVNLSNNIISDYSEERVLTWANNPVGAKIILKNSRLPEEYHHLENLIVDHEMDSIPVEDREKYNF